MSWASVRAVIEEHGCVGLGKGILGPFLYPYQLPPSPCVRTAWARAAIIPAMVAISTCLLGLTLIAAIRGVLMMTLWVSRLFFILSCFPLFLDDLLNFKFLWPFTFSFYLVPCTLFSPGFSFVHLVLGLFLVFSFSHLIPGPAASPSCRVSFDWYDEDLGFSRLDFVYTVCLRHGSKSFFFFAYR